MRHPIRGVSVLAGLTLLAVLAVGPRAAEEGYVGDETCAACHEEVVEAFALTSHATTPGWDPEKGCESCHGPGAAHAESNDPVDIVRPQDLAPREAARNCLSCHRDQHAGFRFGRSTHSLNDISCIDCHNPHSTAQQMLPKRGDALCSTCHQAIFGQFQLPRSHPMVGKDVGDSCSGCHNPHGSNNSRKLRGFGNETCAGCHVDKAGPFLYQHDIAVVDGCVACHQVHGSPNRHLLEHSRLVNLCYQCHTGFQTPTFHNPANFLNEKCTACHTAIHGSNTNPFFLEE